MTDIVTGQNNSSGQQASLDAYNPALPSDVKENVITNNMNLISQRLNGMGVNLLASIQNSTDQTVSSTTPVPLNGLNATVETSGGLVVVVANINYDCNGSGAYSKFSLFIDGVQQTQHGASSITGNGGGSVPLIWFAKLSKGSHNFIVKGFVSGSSYVTPFNGARGNNNELFVAEILI